MLNLQSVTLLPVSLLLVKIFLIITG